MTDDIQRILHSISKAARAKKNRSIELKILFTEFINTHAIERQLSGLLLRLFAHRLRIKLAKKIRDNFDQLTL